MRPERAAGWWVGGLVSVAVAALPLEAWAAGAYRGGEVADGGVIAGTVVWSGELPKEIDITVPAKPTERQHCGGARRKLDRLLVDDKGRGVKNCVVYIEEISRGKPMAEPGVNIVTGQKALLDQVKCTYVPHIMVVPTSTVLAIRNSDATAHNVNARMGLDIKFNIHFGHKNQIAESPSKTGVGNRSGIIELRCNVGHTWMSGYIHVVDHPYYALTDERGRFEFKDVPAGKYTLVCWHEDWVPRITKDPQGNVSEIRYARPIKTEVPDIEVQTGRTTRTDFELSVKSRPTKRKRRR